MNETAAAMHRVTWDDGHPTFHCDGDRTSTCHNFPDCDCEVWWEGHDDQHPYVPHDDECWMLSWLENIEVECTWLGGEGYRSPPRRDGEISAEWDGDSVLWDYASSSVSGRGTT